MNEEIDIEPALRRATALPATDELRALLSAIGPTPSRGSVLAILPRLLELAEVRR